MKTMWNDPKHGAPAPIRARIEGALADRFAQPAARLETAISIAFHAGYDFAKPAVPALDEYDRQLREKAPTLAVFQRDHSTQLEQEKRCRDLWQRLRPWAKGEPAHVLAAKARADREAAERAAAVERRAVELLAEQERIRVDTAHRRAVQAAQKELGE